MPAGPDCRREAHRAAGERRRVRQQERHRVAHLLHAAQPLHRKILRHAGTHRFGIRCHVGQPLEQPGFGRSEREHVHPYVVGCVLDRHLLAQVGRARTSTRNRRGTAAPRSTRVEPIATTDPPPPRPCAAPHDACTRTVRAGSTSMIRCHSSSVQSTTDDRVSTAALSTIPRDGRARPHPDHVLDRAVVRDVAHDRTAPSPARPRGRRRRHASLLRNRAVTLAESRSATGDDADVATSSQRRQSPVGREDRA